MTENDMTGLLLQLADLGVTGIKVLYSGGGDSGAIDEIIYTTQEVTSLEDLDDLDPYSNNVLNVRDLSTSFYSNIEDFATERLLDTIEDWWNNEGGYGNMYVDLTTNAYIIHNNCYGEADYDEETEEYDYENQEEYSFTHNGKL